MIMNTYRISSHKYISTYSIWYADTYIYIYMIIAYHTYTVHLWDRIYSIYRLYICDICLRGVSDVQLCIPRRWGGEVSEVMKTMFGWKKWLPSGNLWENSRTKWWLIMGNMHYIDILIWLPSGYVKIAIERSTIFHGKTHELNGDFP